MNIVEEECNSESVNKSWERCKSELNVIPKHSIGDVINLIHAYARGTSNR